MTTKSIEAAAEALRLGRLVAFPTETVYGLGADATSDRAVAAIFEAKGRPRFNPLIVHVAEHDTARRHAEFSRLADIVAGRFWPGPLTLVLPKRADSPLSLLVSAGLDTVALRVPAHDLARRLLRAADRPLAAPSANRSGRLSPTTAQHVEAELGERVAIILDGGPCGIGVESTVLDLAADTPTILRPGGVPQEEIEAALGHGVAVATAERGGDQTAPRSPGMLNSHYAPTLPLRMNATATRAGEALLGFGPDAATAALNLSPAGDLTEAAANLFAYLHRLDAPGHSGIAVMRVPDRGLGRAINDRLRRAAADR